MRTHPFDPVAFVFGVIFVAIAAVGLTDLRWIGPAALVLVGIVLVVSAARGDDRPSVEHGEMAAGHDEE